MPKTIAATCRDCGEAFQRPVRGRPRELCYTCNPQDRRKAVADPVPAALAAPVSPLPDAPRAVTVPAVTATPIASSVREPFSSAALYQPTPAPPVADPDDPWSNLRTRPKTAPAAAIPVVIPPLELPEPVIPEQDDEPPVMEMAPQFAGPVGSTEPRLYTPPLRELTSETTLGFAFVQFCHEVLREPLLPWQAWLALHAFELAPGCTTADMTWRFRFKVILTIVARQNGKSDISRKIKLFKLYVLGMRFIIGTAQDLDIARMMLDKTAQMIDAVPALAVDKISHTVANGKEKLTLTDNRQYVIKAPNAKAGRGPSADHVDMDELREHKDYGAWNALRPTIRAMPRGQLWGFSNAGDDQSVVLNRLQDQATIVIERGTGDEALQTFMAEWSAPKGCELNDVSAIRQANPALGYLFDINEIWSALENDTPNGYRTETLCQRVDALDGAFDVEAWKDGLDVNGSLATSRERLSFSVDVSLDGFHVTAIIAAELADGRYRLEPAGSWETTEQARRALPGIVARLQPRVIRWFKNGPAAAIGADLRNLAGPGVDVEEITGGEVTETCMEFVDLVRNRRILHGGDPLLNAQITGAGRKRIGDGYAIVRTGKAHVDAVYAMAGAVHGARNLPAYVEEVEPMLIAAW